MPLYKFGAGDVFYNRIKAHPSSSFYIYSGSVYYQNKSTEPGSNVANVNGVPVGNVSLFELNVDRAVTSTGRSIGPVSLTASQNVTDKGVIYPFVYKGLDQVAFKGITRDSYNTDYAFGDVITGSYMMSASITRKLYDSAAGFNDTNKDGAALRNSLDFAKRLGPHYDFPSGSSGSPIMGAPFGDDVNVIYIPSIYYGSEIKKGTVDLKMYITGTLIARCRDSRYDGALIMDFVENTAVSTPRTVGCVLYNEGAIILNDFNSLNTGGSAVPTVKKYSNRTNTTTATVGYKTSWNAFGLGLPQGSGSSLEHLPGQAFLQSASFGLEFAGTHKVPTVTMLANANRGELNYSNNPTYAQSSSVAFMRPITGSNLYHEQARTIKNTHSSSYSDPTGSLEKTTYITKVGIYDDNKKLIGIASVAKPVKKTEDRDLTFKLKLDI